MTTKKRGGKRTGAGRPKGTVRGRNTTTCSISLPPTAWRQIDAARGSTPRGKWIARQLNLDD
jgi:hypothetical protein